MRLASTRSSYSQRRTTRAAIYSNTSETPSPVFADVKNSFGPRAGGGGKAKYGVSSTVGVLTSIVVSRANKLGVIVTALPLLVLSVESAVILLARITGLEGCDEGDDEEDGPDHGSGEERADW